MSGDLASTGRISTYQNEKGDTKIDVYLKEDAIWMTQRSMAELYQVTSQNITLHIRNIYEDGKLSGTATCKNYLQVQTEGSQGVRRDTKFYSLDTILAVGYRVWSGVGIHFRRWASRVLTEYMKEGSTLNDDRLRELREFGADYFGELLECIRDIRASEKRVYQKAKEISALSVDYDDKSLIAQDFFKSVQNKLEYAATGYTAPEIIAARVNASRDNMGLTAFKRAKVRWGDVTVAKNYMTHEEISTLNLTVNMYLDYTGPQAKGHCPMHTADQENKPEEFLCFSGREVLENFRTVKREVAEKLALEQYEQYDVYRRALEAVDDVDGLTADVKWLKR